MKKVIVALDYAQADDALAFVRTLDASACRVKVGKELFTSAGPEFVRQLHALGFEVFLDLKFHDIPATVAKAVTAAAQLGVWMVNVHASGGEEMLKAAASALQVFGDKAPKLIAVTVLTSMAESELQQLGIQRSLPQQVMSLARLSQDCGLDGVVCSAQEAQELRRELGDEFLLVTPGIRPEGTELDDQKRVMTPKQAIDAGVSYLVMGRPIRHATDPVAALLAVNQSITG